MYLGKYPVSVTEYRRFVAVAAYHDPPYWRGWWKTKAEKNWKRPRNWKDQKKHLNRPVVGVSWFEASAYCNWLSKESKCTYRLPKSEEWKKAAINPNGDFPWGNDAPNEELANFEWNVGNPTPVGIYPSGAGPNGHLDMMGNVFEWNQDPIGKNGTKPRWAKEIEYMGNFRHARQRLGMGLGLVWELPWWFCGFPDRSFRGSQPDAPRRHAFPRRSLQPVGVSPFPFAIQQRQPPRLSAFPIFGI